MNFDAVEFTLRNRNPGFSGYESTVPADRHDSTDNRLALAFEGIQNGPEYEDSKSFGRRFESSADPPKSSYSIV